MNHTLRLLMPQWQGGNNPPYSFGARLLSWLAPADQHAVEIEVPIEPYQDKKLAMENGVIARSALLRQLKAAAQIIADQQPKKIITFGGDCLVSQAPFAYLNQQYDGKLGVLWLDAHPDVSTPQMHNHVHAMVLGNLLGHGAPDFAAEVPVPLNPDLVMYGGLQEMTPQEAAIVTNLNLRKASAIDLVQNSQPILAWIKEQQIEHLAIHLDLDVLDPETFRSLLFAKPGDEVVDASMGTMTFEQIARIIQDVSKQTEIVGFTFAEYLPWDAINFHDFLENLAIFK